MLADAFILHILPCSVSRITKLSPLLNAMRVQANLTPEKAAELWPQVRSQSEKLGMELVSPAVNFCYGDCVEEVG